MIPIEVTRFMRFVLNTLTVIVVLAGLFLASFWLMQTAHDWLHTLANIS